MKVSCFALWVAVIFVANVSATSIKHGNRIGDIRSLRVHEVVDEATEERGALSTLTEKAKALLTSKTSVATLDSLVAKKRSPKDALTRLQLSKAGTNLLEKPQLKTWMTYMTTVNKNNPDEAIISTLKSQYKFTDETLNGMIIKAKRNSATEDIATKLQESQLKVWQNTNTNTNKVFNLLQLNRVDRSPFQSPEFSVWTKYLDDMVVPLKDKVILGTLSSHYQDDVLSQMLIAAKKKPETKEMATTLQIEQLQTWLSKKTPADDVFALLQLNKADDKLFDSPQFALWSKYLDDLSGPNKETTMIATLSTHYADEAMIKLINAAKDNPAMKGMATKLEGAQHKKWIAAGTSPVDVFKFYQLDRAGDSLFTSPQFDTWVTYLKRFNAANPKKEPTSQFGTFRKVYGDEDLAKILIKAQGVDKTKDIATKLQEEQIIYWLKSKQKVRDVQKWLGVDKNTASALETAAYKKYEGIYLDQPLVRNGRK